MLLRQKQKKGIQLNDAFGAVLILVMVATLVIVAIYLFANLDTSLDAADTAGLAQNESIAKPTTAGVTLGAAGLRDGSCGTITSVYNGTTGSVLIASGNYTQSGCTVVNATNVDQFGSTWRVNYPYTYSAATAASNASGTMITNFSSYPALVGLVGVIIFLGLVIGVLVASFVFGGKGSA